MASKILRLGAGVVVSAPASGVVQVDVPHTLVRGVRTSEGVAYLRGDGTYVPEEDWTGGMALSMRLPLRAPRVQDIVPGPDVWSIPAGVVIGRWDAATDPIAGMESYGTNQSPLGVVTDASTSTECGLTWDGSLVDFPQVTPVLTVVPPVPPATGVLGVHRLTQECFVPTVFRDSQPFISASVTATPDSELELTPTSIAMRMPSGALELSSFTTLFLSNTAFLDPAAPTQAEVDAYFAGVTAHVFCSMEFRRSV